MTKQEIKNLENSALNELGRLNGRINRLKDEIRASELRLKKTNESIAQTERELISISDKKKWAQSEIAKLNHIAQEIKRQVSISQDELKKHGEKTRAKDEAIRQSREDAEKKIKLADEKNSQSKDILNRIELKRQESEASERRNKESLLYLKKQQEESENALKVADRERREFESARSKNAEISESLASQKEDLVKSLKISKEKQLELDRQLKILVLKESNHQKLLTDYANKLADVERREAKATAIIASSEKEKQAIANERKQLEVEQLRFKKLVREADLDKELAALRKG